MEVKEWSYEEYKADANQMFVAGDSSGGHTAFFSQLINEDENVNIYLKESADMNIYPDVDASVKGIISLYGALSVMLEDGMPSTLNHHQPDSPEGMEMGGVDLRNNTELCRAMSVECNIQLVRVISYFKMCNKMNFYTDIINMKILGGKIYGK